MDGSPQTRVQYPYSQRAHSPTNAHEMYTTSNTVPVYRHGRKFYVPVEEFERMRLEQRRQRRTLLQKSQHLPVTKVHPPLIRAPTIPSYNAVHRSTSHPHDYRYGVLRAPHLPTNTALHTARYEPARQSRLPSRYYDDREDSLSFTSALPTTAIRSNSSDKVLDLQRTPQPSMCSFSDYVADDYDLKRSFSAEIVHPTEPKRSQPLVLPRRLIPTPLADYGATAAPSFPPTASEQPHRTDYYTRLQPSAINPPIKPVASALAGTGLVYDTAMSNADPAYPNAAHRRIGNGLSSVLTRSSSTNSHHDYYVHDAANGSFSDDNSSSPSMLLQRRHGNAAHYRRSQFAGDPDDEYEQRAEIARRPTARSHSSDGFTEKKRVRFADMEGYTLETVPDVEQERSPMNNRLFGRRPYVATPNHLREPVHTFRESFYQTATRASANGSQLATDV